MSRYLLPLIPAGLSVVQVLPMPDRVTIVIVPMPSQSACPLCGGLSGQVHSHYTRSLADLPWQGRAVGVQVRARRFRCATAGCPRQIFTERLSEVAPSPTSTPTRSRSSASERPSSDAASGNDIQSVNHARAPSATWGGFGIRVYAEHGIIQYPEPTPTSSPGNLPRLRRN